MILDKLRNATHTLHKEVEKDNLAGLIISHKITLQQYKTLLYQNYVAYKFTEVEIAEHLEGYSGTKHKQLEKDLGYLQVDPSGSNSFPKSFSCKSRAEALGAAYVVEGSALGGMMIAKEMAHCKDLQHIDTHHFFNGNRDNIKGWRKFCSLLKKENLGPAGEQEAIDKACETFQFFGLVFGLATLPAQVKNENT